MRLQRRSGYQIRRCSGLDNQDIPWRPLFTVVISRARVECYKIPGDQSDETSCVQIGVKSLNSNL